MTPGKGLDPIALHFKYQDVKNKNSELRAELDRLTKCPIGVSVPALCSAASCHACLVDRARAHSASQQRFAELEQALRFVADAHLGDCPAAMTREEQALSHIAFIRGFAQSALSPGEKP